MAFVLAKKTDPVKWPVEVKIPRDGGGFHKQEFTARFLLLDQDEIDAKSEAGDEAFIKHVLVGWDGIKDAPGSEGQPVEFSEDALEAMVKTPYIRKAIFAAYFACISGIGRKNL